MAYRYFPSATCFLALGALSISMLGFSAAAHADESDSQLWTQITFNKRFTSGVRLFAEVQPRLGENFNHWTQLVVRPAVGYQVTPKLSLWLGYGWTPSFFPEFTGENRIFQQALLEDRFHALSLNNRFRLEERFIEHSGGTSVRVRHQIRASHPIRSGSPWSLVGYNELFWNLDSTPRGPQAGFDQDRVYLGTAYNLSKSARVEAGYLAAFVNPPRNRPDRRLDVLMITVNYNL